VLLLLLLLLCRTAVRDLASVQSLSAALMGYDPVTFLQHLEGLRLSEGGSSIWLYHEATHVIYEQVRNLAGLLCLGRGRV
jgi:DNA excision repair protein ERCC-4